MSTANAAFDNWLITVSWTATCTFAAITIIHRHRSPQSSSLSINCLLASIILAAFCAFGGLIGTNPFNVPSMLCSRLYDGTYKRFCLLLFWLLCTAESLLFSMLINCWVKRANTCHRKFFHLTVSLIAISGLNHDPQFLALSAHLVLQIFIIIEVLRSQRIEPWANLLDEWLLIFVDGQDSPDLILTPIFLLAGVFLPLLLDFGLHSPEWAVKQRHFSGVLSVGVGDSFAALVGSRYGRIPWPCAAQKSRKTMEGSLAMFISQILAAECIFGLCSLNTALIGAALLSTLAEAHLHFCDNLVIPLCSMAVFAALE